MRNTSTKLFSNQIVSNVYSLILNKTKYSKSNPIRDYLRLISIELILNGYQPKLFLNFDKFFIYDNIIN
jgi:hypothetical protein